MLELWPAWLAVISVNLLVWFISIRIRDASIVDMVWGVLFIVATGVAWLLQDETTLRGTLCLGLVVLWGARLSAYLAFRNWGHDEDRRYQAMRTKWGGKFWWVSLFTVFLFQAVLACAISFPAQWVQSSPGELNHWDYLGSCTFIFGFLFQAVADRQLQIFLKDKKPGAVMNKGLWRYSRHPNYFGEVVLWWGMYIIVAAAGGAYTVFAPALITFLILKVSGVVMLEKDIAKRRPQYAEYVRTTSSFIPRLPRK